MHRFAAFLLPLLTCGVVAAGAVAYRVEIVQTRSDPLPSVRHPRIDQDGSVQDAGRVWRGPDDFYDIPATGTGTVDDITGGYVAGSVSTTRPKATVWKDGVPLWTSSASTSVALGVNSRGEAAGYAGFAGLNTEQAYFFSATGQPTVITPVVTSSSGFGINRAYDVSESGVVVGQIPVDPAKYNGFTYRAFTWSAADGLVIHDDAAAFEINNLGDRLGWDQLVTADGEVITLPFSPAAFNDNREVVAGDQYWKDGQTSDLDDLVPAGWDISGATGINNAGQIIAHATNGSFSGDVRLTPVPEPAAAAALCALPLAFLLARRAARGA